MPVEDVRSYVLRPGARVIFAGMYERLPAPVEWRVDEWGRRAAPVRRREGTYRIVLHGDSEAFGWGVSAAETMAARMEELDPSLKVLNRGVPGYNIEAIAEHLRATIREDRPDLVIYLMNKNDYYASLTYHPLLSRFRVWTVANFLLYRLRAGRRKAWRRSSEAAAFMARRIAFMRKVAGSVGAAFMVALLDWRYRGGLPDFLRRVSTAGDGNGAAPAQGETSFPVALNLEPVVSKYGKIDHHLTAGALAAAARAICGYLGAGGHMCHPPKPGGRPAP